LNALDLAPFYARVYRSGSEHVHFATHVAVDDLRGVDEVALDAGDPELADEALGLAILTYGALLMRSEKTVEHGLSTQVLELARPLFAG
jgi:hypothetical protein